MNLDYVFAGATISNIRFIKSQEKLPFMRIDVLNEFPDEHEKLESEVNSKRSGKRKVFKMVFTIVTAKLIQQMGAYLSIS